ncbi:M23 family metallopeptidase [Sphingomonas sp. ASV193]|uniref:M23 family metallopeptidase n=1 Tax=Sphingomonas sp. ASV193 TaxID=3144405 RepID=UPI0032E87855
MYQWRDFRADGGGAVFVSPRSFAPRAAGFGRADLDRRHWLAVDLSRDLFTKRWWQGAGTLALLVAIAIAVTPAPEPLPGLGEGIDPAQARYLSDLGVAPARLGGRSGGAMAAGPAVAPLAEAPVANGVTVNAMLGAGDRIGALLMRLGADSGDAVRVDALVRAAAPSGVDDMVPVAIRLGPAGAGGKRRVERVSLRPTMALDLGIVAEDGGFVARRTALPVDATPRRVRGRVGNSLYFSLRSAGVPADTAAEYLKALATKIDVGSDPAADDQFDLVIANKRSSSGVSKSGPLLYAGLERTLGPSVQLMKWASGGKAGWTDADSLETPGFGGFGGGFGGASGGLIWPVNAPITSTFGMRYHPILHITRMHKGIDFGAHWGQPIVAAADGQVVRAGWAGGYGQQVRLAHGGGLDTSYNHMSRMVVAPGQVVRQGQLIGYVGSTGLSTGPHLHFEVTRGGVAVNPMGVRMETAAVARAPTPDTGMVAKFRARMKALLGSARG